MMPGDEDDLPADEALGEEDFQDEVLDDEEDGELPLEDAED